MDRRQVTWVVIGSIAVAAIALLAWWFLFGRATPPPERNVPANSGGFDFFPVSGNPSLGGFSTSSSFGGGGDAERIPSLRQLSDAPTAGAIAYHRSATPSTLPGKTGPLVYFRWVERATGHIYEVREDDLTKARISNTTIPGVQEAFFSGDAKKVLLRYLRPDNETVETALGEIKAVTATTSSGLVYGDTRLVSTFLPPNIEQVAVSPGGDRFAELLGSDGGGQVRVASFVDGTSVALYESPLAEWNLAWPTGGEIALTTRPASGVDGYLYTIDASSGSDAKVLQRVPGLTALMNPSGTRLLYAEAASGDLRLRVRNLKTGEDKLLELRGLPDKCAWSQTDEKVVYCGAPDRFYRGNYPANWYQGLISFNDNIWRINVDTEYYHFLFDASIAPQRFDAYRLTVSPDDEFLMFANKQDLTLWSIDLEVRGPKAK